MTTPTLQMIWTTLSKQYQIHRLIVMVSASVVMSLFWMLQIVIVRNGKALTCSSKLFITRDICR